MQWTETKRTVAMLLVGSTFAFGVVRMIQSGEDRTRELLREVDRAAGVRDAQAIVDRHRIMLLIETIKQAQAITASEEYTDRRINDMLRRSLPVAKPATKPVKTE